MDGFKERLNARRELNEKASNMNRYDRIPDIRYEALAEDRNDKPVENRIERPEVSAEDRYERVSARRNESVSIEAVSDVVNRSGQQQLEVIEDLFRNSHSDIKESERQIIDTLSGKMDVIRNDLTTISEAAASVGYAANNQPRRDNGLSGSDSEKIKRIEIIAQKTREAIEITSEELDKNYEALNAVRAGIGEVRAVQNEMRASNFEMQQNIQQSIQQGIYAISQQRMDAPQPMVQPVSVQGSVEGREDIIGAVNDNRSLLNMIRQELLSVQSSANATPPTVEVDIDAIADLMEKHYADLEDHVHKECVKCYRNVQQALTEQTAETQSKIEKNVANVKSIATISLILNAVTLFGVIVGIIVSSGILN